ncbi:MAG: hypothetical protein Kow0099_20560 [Candidatus Abyssubacteria bacterium]
MESLSYQLKRNWRWVAGGVTLIVLHIVLARISPEFPYGRDLLEKPLVLLVALEMVAGVVYLLVIVRMVFAPAGTRLLAWILGVGLVLRIVLLNSTPMQEDDYYRYLWDGAVVAEGINPYAYAPDLVRQSEISAAIPGALERLADESGDVVQRVNHAHLRTIYPPTAQAAFALAHWLRPWSMVAWRVVLLAFDVAVLVMLALVLRAANLSLVHLAIYWWNPLLVKEVFNSGHMDVVALPFVLGAVLLAIHRRHAISGILLGVAAGAKIWPAVLLPIVLRNSIPQPRKALMAAGGFGVVMALMCVPIYFGGLDDNSGFTAYGRMWEMNDALYMLFLWGVKFLGRGIELGSHGAHLITRLIVGTIVVLWTLWLSRRPVINAGDLSERCLLVVAAVFLLSPTQYPWYYVWMLPFLAIRPRLSLLLLTALLPLYYLRFRLVALEKVGMFDHGVVWLEYAPVWILLIRETIRGQTLKFDKVRKDCV